MSSWWGMGWTTQRDDHAAVRREHRMQRFDRQADAALGRVAFNGPGQRWRVRNDLDVASRQRRVPVFIRRDDLVLHTFQFGVIYRAVDFAASGVDHRRTLGFRPVPRESLQIRDRNDLFAGRFGEPLDGSESDANPGEGTGAGGGGEAIDVAQSERVPREKALDLDKDHVREAVGGVKVDLLDELIVDRKREAAGCSGRVERKDADAHGVSL